MSDDNRTDRSGERKLSRRSFLKWSAVLGGTAAAVTQLGGGFKASERVLAQSQEKIVWSSCNVNCGSRCALRLHVLDGQIVRVETDNTGTDEYGTHQVRACVRGRSIRKRVYNADRLKYPMKRVGKRGEGKFEQITWEEAFDTIASNLKRIKEQHGNEAIYINYGTGTLGGTIAKSWPPGSSAIARLMNCYGGYLNQYGTYSAAQIEVALPYTFGGGWVINNGLADIVNSKLMVLFGDNPAETRMSGGGEVYDMIQLRRQTGLKVIVIDPRYSETALLSADEWVPIKPGTDTALVNGLAYVMISENLVDKAFLDKYCVGYDEQHMPAGIPAGNSYESYILGRGPDGIAKTPEWAAKITGIPAATIVRLAREMALTKPMYVSQGWGLQRQANGEQNCRAVSMIPILTGNVGIHGGSTGARMGGTSIPWPAFPVLENPVKTSIPMYLWTEAIEKGSGMTAINAGVKGADKLGAPMKFLWNYGSNCIVNQHGQINQTHEILQDDTKLEMLVVIDVSMTPSAKYADILLPDCTNFEHDDFASMGDSAVMGYGIFASKAIEPMFECKTIYDMCAEIAKRIGVEQQFTEGMNEEQWLRKIWGETMAASPALPDYETMKQQGIYKIKDPNPPFVCFAEFRADPAKNPLPTPTGKIEIFSQALWDIGKTWELPQGDVITALPEYTPTWEGPDDPLREKFPLQLIGHHYKQRTHSSYGNVDWLQEVSPQALFMNPIDARARGLKHGDRVKVYNDRGASLVPLKVTTRIMPGVVSLPEGAWYAPDANGVDTAGCVNVLTSLRPSPLAKGNSQHTNLVQVEKA